MYNWSVDETELKKHPEEYQIWRLEQLINYGLDGEKLDKKILKKYFKRLYIEDPYTRRFLKMLLWPKKS